MTVIYRPYAPDDLPALLVVHNTCRERDAIDPYSVCYQLPNLPAERYAEQLAKSEVARVAEVDGTIVAHGFMEVWGFDERCYLWRVWVMSTFRSQGIGTTLLEWGEEKARQLHGQHQRQLSQAGRVQGALHLANATEHERDAVALLEEHSYKLSFISVELAFDATMPIPDAQDIGGVTFRSLDRARSSAVAYALSEANLTEFTGAERQARMADQEAEWLLRIRDSDEQLSVVAYDDTTGEVIGAYLCQRKDKVGEIAQVAVRVPWRNRGIARSLAMRSLHQLKAAGCDTVRLFTSTGPDEVEPTHGPYAMYRKFGFYPIAKHLRFRKPMTKDSSEQRAEQGRSERRRVQQEGE